MKQMNAAQRQEFTSAGGQARARKLSKCRRVEIAREAAKARWGK